MKLRALGVALALAAPLVTIVQPAIGATAPVNRATAFVNVVAHEDDDILFMNPDVAGGIRAGVPTATVFLTAGENAFAGDPANDPDDPYCPKPPNDGGNHLGDLSRERYAQCRQQGVRAAYAQMAGVADVWDGALVDVTGGDFGELYTLRAKPSVKLVFLDLPEDGDAQIGGSLYHLYFGDVPNFSTDTLVPTDGVVQRSYSYNRADTVNALVALYQLFRADRGFGVQDTTPGMPGKQDRPRGIFQRTTTDHVMAGSGLRPKALGRYTRRTAYDRISLEGVPRLQHRRRAGEPHARGSCGQERHVPGVQAVSTSATWEIDSPGLPRTGASECTTAGRPDQLGRHDQTTLRRSPCARNLLVCRRRRRGPEAAGRLPADDR
ncbi:PIG-L family deacetylase [Kutzneria sp. 744]|uniref:PIG-L family deacetylase n=1 Tax=Kutzneria sp. (strain 744) TaxID=345341 RepID=UPI000A04E05C|nr:PIG-L family deacetylase [Kutzneria sp. 744]